MVKTQNSVEIRHGFQGRTCASLMREILRESGGSFFGPESHCVLASRPVYTDPRIGWLINIDWYVASRRPVVQVRNITKKSRPNQCCLVKNTCKMYLSVISRKSTSDRVSGLSSVTDLQILPIPESLGSWKTLPREKWDVLIGYCIMLISIKWHKLANREAQTLISRTM